MNFIFFDVSLLILFTILVFIFIYKNKKNMKREGIMFLYKTQLGVKIIKKIAEKQERILRKLKWVVIISGFLLMVAMVYMLGYSTWQYLTNARIFESIKAPPIAPLIPYFPKIFGMESFFPELYFIYFIVVIGIVAVGHEFFHGIYMHLFKVKIKSTGFAFLGPILGAFVEQDEKQMQKKPASEQMTILGAGVFANFLLFIMFFIILFGFFAVFYAPSGYIFNTYSITALNKTDIVGIKQNENLTEILSENGKIYFLDKELAVQLNENFSEKDNPYLLVYEGAAVKAGLKGAIIEIDGVEINDREDLQAFLQKTSPGKIIQIKTKVGDVQRNYEIQLGENPQNSSVGFLGIGSYNIERKGVFSKAIGFFMKFKDPNTLYEAKIFSSFSEFIYNFIWWALMINLFVALFNMLPLGILDGGRFFYLLVFSITKSEKISKAAFKLITWAILGLFIAMMLFWFYKRYL